MGKQKRRGSAPRTNELIHCDNCGEDYASTYRSCPFCEKRPTRARGGSRLKTNTKGGGYGGAITPLQVIGWVASAMLVIAAVVIVVKVFRQLLPPKDVQPSASPSPSAVVTPAPSGEASAPPAPTPTVSTLPVAGLALNRSDVTLQPNETLNLTATVFPADWGGTVAWQSDSPGAHVSETGLVTNVNTGSTKVKATITAAAGDMTAVCTIYCMGGSTGLPGGTGEQPPSGQTPPPSQAPSDQPVTLNKTDFTIRPQDPANVQLRASGGTGSYTWATSDAGVASVSADGMVTKVGRGTCTITCTSGSSAATCIVRIS